MVLISEKKRLSTTRVGKIMEVNVNFNFDQEDGNAPSCVSASCSIPGATPESGSCNINITRQANGQKSTQINGNKNILELYPIIEEIETELEIIAAEGVVA